MLIPQELQLSLHYSTMFQTFQLLICYINNNIPIEKTLSYEDDY